MCKLTVVASVVWSGFIALAAGGPATAQKYDVAVIGGGAAGIAAALAAKAGVRAHEVDIAQLRRRLAASGAIVPVLSNPTIGVRPSITLMAVKETGGG